MELGVSDSWDAVDDILFAMETSAHGHEGLVAKYRTMAERDLGLAAVEYFKIASRIEPDRVDGGRPEKQPASRKLIDACAELGDVLGEQYQAADIASKLQMLDGVLAPLVGTEGNTNYVKKVLTRMRNPYLVGDIFRKYPLLTIRPDKYKIELAENGALVSVDSLIIWLAQHDDNMFAASSIALQQPASDIILEVMRAKGEVFARSAHVVAAGLDRTADYLIALSHRKGLPSDGKEEMLARFRQIYVDQFATMIKDEAEQANWIPVDLSGLK